MEGGGLTGGGLPGEETPDRDDRGPIGPPIRVPGDPPRDDSADVTDWESAYEVGYFGQRRPKPFANEEYALTTGPGSPGYPLGAD